MKSDPGMDGAEIEITGTDAARARAKDYIGYVLAQRTGPVYIDHTMRRDDLSILMVPMDCVGYVMGRGGQVLRDMENEWGTLMFFAKKKEDEGKADADAKDGKVQEILAIFGTRRSRRGAELKVMSAVEHKKPGHFLDGEALRVPLDQPGDGENDDFDYDVFPFRGDEFSYALGGRGLTRKKIAAASNCILEYVAQVAFARQRGIDVNAAGLSAAAACATTACATAACATALPATPPAPTAGAASKSGDRSVPSTPSSGGGAPASAATVG